MPRGKPLSLKKLINLLTKNQYLISAIYVSTGPEEDSIRYIEARTPKHQKTFVIYIPTKYTLTPDTDAHKRFTLEPLSEESNRQIAYLMDVKSPVIVCDLVSISSTKLSMYRNGGGIEVFQLTHGASSAPREDDDADRAEDEGEDEVGEIVATMEEVAGKVDPEGETLLLGEADELEDAEGEEPAQRIELEFVDEPDDPANPNIPELMNDEDYDDYVDADEVEEAEPAKKTIGPEEKVTAAEPPPKPKRGMHSRQRVENSMPPHLEEDDVALGIVYFSIDLPEFYKKLETLESEILSTYDAIDDAEKEARETALQKLTGLAETLLLKAKSKMEEYSATEVNLKSEVTTLSLVLARTEALRKKVESDPKKRVEYLGELEAVYNRTRTTIYDINVELLRVRDAAADVLNEIGTSLEELIGSL